VKVIVNPEIERVSDERESAQEGCLSIAGVNVAVERAAQVLLRAQDLSGERITVDASGLEARVIQHELDHLDGVLILDRISREERREAMRAMRESREAGAGRADGGR
jgi:peptide deformylase